MEKQNAANVTYNKKQHRRQKMNLSMAVIISHHTVYFPKRKTVILNISRESSAQIQNLVFLLLIT